MGVRRTSICERSGSPSSRPIPEPPPVTTAILPAKSFICRASVGVCRSEPTHRRQAPPTHRSDSIMTSLPLTCLDGCAGTSGAGPVRFGWVAVCRGCSYPHAGSNPPPGPQRSPLDPSRRRQPGAIPRAPPAPSRRATAAETRTNRSQQTSVPVCSRRQVGASRGSMRRSAAPRDGAPGHRRAAGK